jgi:hypothetical protein
LSEAKQLWLGFPTHKRHDQRFFASLRMTAWE